MAKKFIDADILFKTITDNHYFIVSKYNSVDYGMFTAGIKQAIDETPAADVQEVKHGKWIAKKIIKESYNYGVPYEIFRCSECLYMLSENGLVRRYNYCPHCGARMDGEEE